jgi:hypothetical protein
MKSSILAGVTSLKVRCSLASIDLEVDTLIVIITSKKLREFSGYNFVFMVGKMKLASPDLLWK